MFPSSSPKAFLSGSPNVPQVPNAFPNTFPIKPQFYPIHFAYSSTSMYINCKEGAKGKHIKAFMSKKSGDGPINVAPSIKKKKTWCAPPPY